jgi:glycerate dehydrogenase
MNIVVLDGFALNPGDLSWDELHQIGNVEIYDRTSADEILPRAHNAEIVLTNKTPLSRDTIFKLQKLRYVGVLATGFNVIDTEAARDKNIIVANVPGYGASSVAQATWALLLELTNRVGQHSHHVHRGAWSRNADWSYHETPLRELCGATFGIIGFGDIGKQVAKIAKAFNMRVLIYSRTRPADEVLQKFEVEFADLETLLRQSDIVSLHCPLTPQTQNLINEKTLSQMKRDAFLINTARGPLIDENALANALRQNQFGGAGLDVLSAEPPPENHPLLGISNCIITPHNAWATRVARERLMKIAVKNVRAFENGTPQNVVNL